MVLIFLCVAFFWVVSGIATITTMRYFLHEYSSIHPVFQHLLWPYVLWELDKKVLLKDSILFQTKLYTIGYVSTLASLPTFLAIFIHILKLFL